MADYTIGGLGAYGRGTMMMRDHGYNVEFFVYVGYSGTYWGSVGWSYSSPGGSGGGAFGYPGGSVWKSVGTIAVGSSGKVSWTVGATGTSEFGGPHTQTVYINRSSRPSPPGTPTFSNLTSTGVTVSWTASGSNGGSSIDAYLLRYWPNADGTGPYTDHSQQNNLSRVVTGLPAGGKFRFRVYAHNGSGDHGGYSNPSGDAVVVLSGIIRVRVSGVWKNAILYIKHEGVWKLATPYIKKDGVWVEAKS